MFLKGLKNYMFLLLWWGVLCKVHRLIIFENNCKQDKERAILNKDPSINTKKFSKGKELKKKRKKYQMAFSQKTNMFCIKYFISIVKSLFKSTTDWRLLHFICSIQYTLYADLSFPIKNHQKKNQNNVWNLFIIKS